MHINARIENKEKRENSASYIAPRGISIKQFTEQDVEHGIIICHSLNNMFHDYKVCPNDVAELYNVIKVIDRSMRL